MGKIEEIIKTLEMLDILKIDDKVLGKKLLNKIFNECQDERTNLLTIFTKKKAYEKTLERTEWELELAWDYVDNGEDEKAQQRINQAIIVLKTLVKPDLMEEKKGNFIGFKELKVIKDKPKREAII